MDGSDRIDGLADLANKRLNSTEDFEAFQSFVTRTFDLDTIYSLIDEKLDSKDGPKVLEYILVGLSVKPDSQQIVEKVYEYVLNAINTADISEKMKVCLISRLSLELNKLSTEQLIKFINMCKKDIEDSNENSVQSWKELIPQILKIVSEIKTISTEGLEMSGADYKEMIISDICRFKAQSNIIVPLALMFRRTKLTEKEHELVITTLCSYFTKMNPQEIPPLLQQILHFCTGGDFLNLFCTLQKYFDSKNLVYCSNNENNTFEIEVSEKKELLEAESTVLFLLEDFAKIHPSFVNDITKYIKNSIGAPNLVFGSFLLAFLLTMSCCGPYEVIVIDLIKKLVVQSLVEVENTQRSCWLKINFTDIYNVYTQFQLFIKSEISSYEKVFKGLVNLSLSFLGANPSIFKKNSDIIDQIHQLGLLIIVSLVHKQSFITGSVLRKLTDLITSNPMHGQYLECLHKLCKNQRTAVLENHTELLRLFKEIPVGITDKVTFAVMPVLKVSTYLRDNVIIILRKELMSKDYQLRHSAVLGFVEILCSVRLDNFNALSQNTNSQDSWPGLFTQVILDRNSVDIHSNVDAEDSSDNRSICLEILDVLKTCFFQKSEIKRTLYRGLIRVTSHHSELCGCVHSLLLDHLSSWCNRRVVGNKQSLKFDKSIVVNKDNESIVQEPLEELILLAQHVLITSKTSDENEKYCDVDELKTVISQLASFYCECNMDEIKVNDSDCLLDIIPNAAQHAEVVKQILCVYQAFMVYVVNSWRGPDQDDECCEQLQKLFSKYNHIVDAVLESDKTAKKKDKGNKKNKPETTGTASKFVEPAIHLDFDVLYKFLSLLTQNEDWHSEMAVAPLKRNVQLWEFVLKMTQSHLAEVKNLLSRDTKPRYLYTNLCRLTKLLYDHFLFDICVILQFSRTVLELGLECYLQVIQLVSSYYKKLDAFLFDSSDQTGSSDKPSEIFNVLRNVKSHLDNVLEMNRANEVSVADDTEEAYDKIERHLIGCVSVMCRAIRSDDHAAIKNILVWLCSVAEKHAFSNVNNTKEFLSVMLETHAAHQEDPILLATTIKCLCDSFGRVNSAHKPAAAESQPPKPFGMVTVWNRTAVCPALCQCLCVELNYVLLCLARVKAELGVSHTKTAVVCSDRLMAREKAICHRTVLVMLAAVSFTKAAVPLGQCTESVFNLLYQVYRTVNVVTRHFLARSSYHEPVYKRALFGKLSEIVNDQLSPNVSKFIMFVEHDRPMTDKEKKSAQVKNQTRRQASYIPRVVTELELFVNLITKLGKKCKDQQLMNNIKITSSRDFRLNVHKLQNMLNERNDSAEDASDDDRGVSDGGADDGGADGGADGTSDQPPRKRRRSDSDGSVGTVENGSPVY